MNVSIICQWTFQIRLAYVYPDAYSQASFIWSFCFSGLRELSVILAYSQFCLLFVGLSSTFLVRFLVRFLISCKVVFSIIVFLVFFFCCCKLHDLCIYIFFFLHSMLYFLFVFFTHDYFFSQSASTVFARSAESGFFFGKLRKKRV